MQIIVYKYDESGNLDFSEFHGEFIEDLWENVSPGVHCAAILSDDKGQVVRLYKGDIKEGDIGILPEIGTFLEWVEGDEPEVNEEP